MAFVLFFSFSISGCQIPVAGKALRILGSTHIRGRSVEHVGGEQLYIEKFEPEGRSFFIIFRLMDEERSRNWVFDRSPSTSEESHTEKKKTIPIEQAAEDPG